MNNYYETLIYNYMALLHSPMPGGIMALSCLGLILIRYLAPHCMAFIQLLGYRSIQTNPTTIASVDNMQRLHKHYVVTRPAATRFVQYL